MKCCCLLNLCRIYKDLSQIKDALLPHTPEGDEERKEIPESDSMFLGLALFVHSLFLGITEKTYNFLRNISHLLLQTLVYRSATIFRAHIIYVETCFRPIERQMF